MTKKLKPIIYILIFILINILIVAIIIGTYLHIHKTKEAKHRQEEIAIDYHRLWGCIPNEKAARTEYADYSVVQEDELFIAISAYNSYTGNKLTLDKFKDFLSEEYNADGSLRVEDIDDEIEEYMEWYAASGKKVEVPEYEADLHEIYYEFLLEHKDIDVGYDEFTLEQWGEFVKKKADSSYEIDALLWE